jgi:hypothetical protein
MPTGAEKYSQAPLQMPAFAGSLLPVTMGFADLYTKVILPHLADSDEAWFLPDRLLAWLCPSMLPYIRSFYSSRGPDLGRIMTGKEIEALDQRLAYQLARSVERIRLSPDGYPGANRNAESGRTCREKQMQWLPDVIRALKALGGEARMKDICARIRMQRENLPEEWEAAVRATIYHFSSGAKAYIPGCPDIFKKTGYGVWALRWGDETFDPRSPASLVSKAVSEISPEALKPLAGDPKAIEALIEKKVAEVRRRYKV